MNTDLKKWNPFKFLRSSGHNPRVTVPPKARLTAIPYALVGPTSSGFFRAIHGAE